MNFKELYDRWESINIIVRILAGLLVGVTLALIMPGNQAIPVLGDVFVGALKAIAPILIMFLVVGSLSRSKKDLGNRFKFVVTLYVMSTVIAAVVATLLSFAFPVTVTLDIPPEHMGHNANLVELIGNLLVGMVGNPVSAIIHGNYLCILFWSIVSGMVLRGFASENTLKVIDDLSEVVTRIIRLIISCAPFGIMGLVYDSISANGLGIFEEYAALVGLLVAAMLIVMMLTNPAMVAAILRRNPYPLQFRCLRDSGITAFCTRNSSANIPVNIALCEKLGVNKEFYSVSIPLGASINMNGAAITITVMTLATVHSIGMEVPIATALVLCLVSTIAACGASSVAGGSLLLIPLACSMFGIGDDIAMQMVAIGFVISVIQDSLETALNSSSDVFFTAAADAKDRMDKGEEFPLKL